MIDEGRDQFAEQEFEAERRRDREADHAPAREGARRLRFGTDLPLVDPADRDSTGMPRPLDYAAGDELAVEATVKISGVFAEVVTACVTRSRVHDARCDRTHHGGPCRGPLRFERPETDPEAYERKLDAIEAVLRRRLRAFNFRDAWVRELAEACYAAADTGI